MLRFALGRLAYAVPTLLGMSVVAFLLMALAPGDPIQNEIRFLGIEPRPETIQALRAQYDLDAPVPVRYARWLARLVRGDLGNSLASGRPVVAEIGGALPATLALAVPALLAVILLSTLLGLGAALHEDSRADVLIRGASILAVSVPAYWLALLALQVFAVWLGWTQVLSEGRMRDAILPIAVLALGPSFAIGRMIRERALDVLREDHIRLAMGLGLSPLHVVRRHVLRNTLAPIVTIWATTFGYLLGGSVIVEAIFGWPGLGRLALRAIDARDFPMIQAYLCLAGLAFVLVNLAADLIHAALDPRLRRRHAGS